MTDNRRAVRRGLPLVRTIAIAAPIVGIFALVLGVADIVDGNLTGYVVVVLGLLMLAMGYFWIRILRTLRDRAR